MALTAQQAYILAKKYTAGTADDLERKIDDAIVGVFTPGGSLTFDNLPELSDDVLGFVYTITDEFTTDLRFKDGAGIDCPANTNVAVVNIGTVDDPVYKFDIKTSAIVVDSTPTQSSKNAVSSGGTYSAIHTAVSAETSAREVVERQLALAISALNHDLSVETSARQLVDSNLQRALSQAISTLNSEVSTEVSARQALDTRLSAAISALNTDISNEVSARQALDTRLTNAINGIGYVDQNTVDSDFEDVFGADYTEADQQYIANAISDTLTNHF